MRLRNVPGAREAIAENRYCVQEPEKYKGNWRAELFQNNNPLHVEIGMGKGDFIIELARQNPQINYIGIEKFSSVLFRAIEKFEAEANINNLLFLRFDATELETIFAEGEVDRIYLNFSDPWPKDRHAKRRLTSPQFLAIYDRVMAPNAEIQFKTDNRDLFDYSVGVVEATARTGGAGTMCPGLRQETAEVGRTDISDSGQKETGDMGGKVRWRIEEITYDLHHSDRLAGNVMTEYEKKFVAEGHPICRFVISRMPNNDEKNDEKK